MHEGSFEWSVEAIKLVISSVSNSGLPAKNRTVLANGRWWCKGVTSLKQAEDLPR